MLTIGHPRTINNSKAWKSATPCTSSCTASSLSPFSSLLSAPDPHILDIGTGKGNWAIDVADKYPRATVYGVDLYPPPSRWIPPNVHLDVDDVLQPWTFAHKFSFIHLRHLHGSFSGDEWKLLYQRCFDALEPGGWIEQAECSHVVHSSDGTVKSDSVLAQCSSLLSACGERSLRPIDIAATMASSIKTAGFDNVQEREWQIPIGAWPKDRFLKEIGRINKAYWDQGLEGWALRLLTKYGEPQPWSADEVRTYVGKIEDELKNRKTHPWHLTRRVWAQKPNNV